MRRNAVPLLLSSLLAFCMVLLLLPGAAQAADSGTCGDGLTWSYADGILTIQGAGTMNEYNEYDSARPPWFAYREQMHTVNISDGVTSIGKYAFAFCGGLTSVTIPSSVNSIGGDAFRNCTALASLDIPYGVTSIGSGAFDGSGLASVTIPNSITSLDGAFIGCKSLTSVNIPDSVTSLRGFHKCESLTSINIPNSVTSIGLNAFSYSGLTSVTIPDSVTTIGEQAFLNCHSLTSVTIPNSVTTIEQAAFAGTALTSVNIPDSVTSLGNGAFNACDLTSITLSNNLTRINYGAFWDCPNLTSINIPNGVTSIDEEAFDSCSSLTSVTIPASVTSIGNSAFINCKSLTDIYYGGNESQWGQIDMVDSVRNLLGTATIHYSSTGPGSTPSAPSTPTETTPSTGFTDVAANSAFAPAISWAVENGVTTGKTPTTFAPNENCTNGQILTFLWRANGSPEPTIDNPFTDSIPASFQKAAVWAHEKGLVSGGVFGSDTPCTRSMVVTYLWQLAGKPTVSGSASFPDVASGAEYAQAVMWAVENSITTGKTDGTFAPGEVCTRGQIVTFLYRDFA